MGSCWGQARELRTGGDSDIVVMAVPLRVVAIEVLGLWTSEAPVTVPVTRSVGDMLLKPIDPTPSHFSAISKLGAATAASLIHRRGGGQAWRGVSRFFLVAMAAMITSTAVVYLASQFVYPVIGKLVATIASALVNYVGSHRFVFAPARTDAPAERRESTV